MNPNQRTIQYRNHVSLRVQVEVMPSGRIGMMLTFVGAKQDLILSLPPIEVAQIEEALAKAIAQGGKIRNHARFEQKVQEEIQKEGGTHEPSN